MTNDEIALRAVNEIAESLREKYRKQAVEGNLDTDGDATRRIAATKYKVLDEVVVDLELKLKRGK